MIKVYNAIIGILFVPLLLINLSVSAQETTSPQNAAPIVLDPASDKNDNYVILANNEFIKGEWESGKEILDEGLAQYPKYSDFHMLAGKYYLNYKEYDKARYSLHKALEYNQNNVEAKHILVNVEEQTQRYSSAIGYVNDLLEVTPYWKGLWQKKIELYEKQGNKEEAARLRKRIFEIYPGDKSIQDDYFYYAGGQAREKAKEGKVDEAIKIYKDIVNKQPNEIKNYFYLINEYTKIGDLYNALIYTEQGLKQFPNNEDLILKKAGILSEQNRYSELLPFLLQEGIMDQYDYYQLQAAQAAKNQEATVIYGKIFARNPGNYEAFSHVFGDALSRHQYQEALNILNTYRQIGGNTKDLAVMELEVYQKMGNTSRADALILQLFNQFPDDSDIRQAYVEVKMKEAKDKINAKEYESAIRDWKEVIRYGEQDVQLLGKNAVYDAYLQLDEFDKASNILSQLIEEQPENINLHVKRASIYYKQEQYNQALTAYERTIQLAEPSVKERHLSGYADMMAKIIKTLNEQYKYDVSYELVKRWIDLAPTNSLALHYAFNLAHLTGDHQAKKKYAEIGNSLYPENIYFTIKLAEIKSEASDLYYNQIFHNLYRELNKYPHNQELIDALISLTSKYGSNLLKHKQSQEAIEKIDTALYYAPDNKALKYTKGLAFEQLHQYDSAYYYQSFYEPEIMEYNSFKQHLQYLGFKSKANQVGIIHLLSRHGDNHSISSASTLEYTRFEDNNTYTGRVNYTGRPLGKGIQIQGEWSHKWNKETYTMINVAWANRFFPHWNLNGSIFRYVDFAGGMQFEVGLGYREFYKKEMQLVFESSAMYNVVVGATKNINSYRLSAKFNNFLLHETYMFNLSFDHRYFLSSPNTYIMAVGSIGTSPEVELVDYQLYDGFDILNTMVGGGFGHMLYENISIGILGSWYNYKANTSPTQNLENYNNLYNIYLQLHVAF
ncbi:YaiO family outer membrane beta-barrel protein [Arenibacter latericius]|uniref:YaiO family outer membrane beta-barrel protein n=1 Tax=Arenibacter latericius TaxID=86104 RepID=UPI000404621C|nr:YaiO family outer membrane beta-barrel protein [Arenibacter latericius]